MGAHRQSNHRRFDGGGQQLSFSPSDIVRANWRSPALRATVVFGLAGLGFAAANIIFARSISAAEYGRLTLVVALVVLASQLGPAGLDGVINRRRLAPSSLILVRALSVSTLVATIAAGAGYFVYGLERPLLILLWISSLAGGVTTVAAAYYQSALKIGRSLVIYQGLNAILLGAALATALAGAQSAVFPLIIVAAGVSGLATVAWTVLLHQRPPGAPDAPERPSWTESLSYVGVRGAGALLVVMDRLVIPWTLSFEDLATFGVLAAVAGSPFRMLQSGVGYTLLPRLLAAQGVERRRSVMRSEAITIATVVVVAAIALLALTRPLIELLVSGAYVVSMGVVVAMVMAGLVKVASEFSVAAATSLCNSSELARLSGWSWLGLAASLGCAVYGARWGLAGVIYGVAAGWLLRGAIGAWFVRPYLRVADRPAPRTS